MPELIYAHIDAAPDTQDYQPSAFAKRQALMPMWGARPIGADHWSKAWQAAQQAGSTEGVLAYIHVPFCANHCVFCGFYRNGWREDNGKAFVTRLIAELANDARHRPAGAQVEALYFGGGTPTLLETDDLVSLIAAARAYLPLTQDCEITIEGRVSHFSADKVAACAAAGANRFSFGVQTFDGALRRRLGRKHDGEQLITYLRNLRQRTDAALVVDLMFGLPGQNDDCWANDLATATSLEMDGLDLYAFNAYPELPMLRMIEKGALPALPALAEQARHYATAVGYLQLAGWKQLSNSHFASTSKERNRYNALLKTGRECLAFGSGAGGKLAGVSYQVQKDLNAYLNSAFDEKPLSHMALVGEQQGLVGRLQGALDGGEFPLTLLHGNCQALARIEHWKNQSLLEVHQESVKLTTAGRFWAPTMTRELVMLVTTKED